MINLKKPNESQENWRIDLGDKEVTNNFQSSRRQAHTRYQNSFFRYCFNCYRSSHKEIDCKIPIKRNVAYPRKQFGERNYAQNRNPYSILLEEIECSKCNNFGHTVEQCRLKKGHNDDMAKEICDLALYAQKDENKWYINNGCTKHMNGNKNKFITLKRNQGFDVSFGDNGTTNFLGK